MSGDIYYEVLKSVFKVLAVMDKQLRQKRNSVCKLGWQIYNCSHYGINSLFIKSFSSVSWLLEQWYCVPWKTEFLVLQHAPIHANLKYCI